MTKRNPLLGSCAERAGELMVDRPIVCCLCNWAFVLFTIFVVFGIGAFSFAELGVNDFVVVDEDDVQNNFALSAAKDLIEGNVSLAVRSEDLFSFGPNFLYEPESGPLFTPENVQAICQVESLIFNEPDFAFVCPTLDPDGSDTVCEDQTTSLTLIFYGSYNCSLLPQTAIDAGVTFLQNNPGIAGLFVDDAFSPTIARSFTFFAGPLGEDSPPNVRFEQVPEDFTDQQTEEGYIPVIETYNDGVFDLFGIRNGFLRSGYFTRFFTLDGTTLQVRTGSNLMDTVEFDTVISVDQAISAGSYLVVMAILTCYLKSLIHSMIGMLAVLSSLATGLFLFRVVFQIDYFTPINILVLFLVAGIGADNILVLNDAFAQSQEEVMLQEIAESKESEGEVIQKIIDEGYEKFLKKRLKYAYARAALSVSQTASTTFIAFLATAVSPISVLAGLGIYAACVILFNLVWMFTVHPANLMFHHYLFRKKRERAKFSSENLNEILLKKKNEKVLKTKDDISEGTRTSWSQTIADNYVHLMLDTKFPYLSITIATIIGIVLINSTTQLQTPSELESNFPAGHMFSTFASDFNNRFTDGTDDAFTLVTGVFGIKELDSSGLQRFSSEENFGAPIFNDDFELFSEESQNAVLDFCQNLTTLECNEEGCIGDFLVRASSIECWLEDFQQFVVDETDFDNSFVGAVDGIPDEETFLEILVNFTESVGGAPFADLIGLIDGELKFIGIEYRMSMIQFQPLLVKEPVLELFDEFDVVVQDSAPPGLNTFYQTSFDHFWQHTERAFVTGLFQGMFISLAASFFVVFFGTRSFLVALYAILGVALTVTSVLGTIQYLGFELGTAESVAGVFVIGLAVDYIVHIGHLFMHSTEFLQGIIRGEELTGLAKFWVLVSGEKRNAIYYNREMVEFSVRKIGGTVLAGAVTTFCSALFLSICTFAFFRKMSVLLMLTIFYSVCYCFFFFVPMIRTFGPGHKGSRDEVSELEVKKDNFTKQGKEEKSDSEDLEKIEVIEAVEDVVPDAEVMQKV